MKCIMKSTNDVTHSWYVVDLLRELQRKGIGTTPVESLAGKLANNKEKVRRQLVKHTMTARLKDAHKDNRRKKYENKEVWKEEDTVLIREGVLEAFLVVWTKEKKRWKQKLRTQRKKKIKWLVDKYKRKDDLPEHYEGYRYKDSVLGEEFQQQALVVYK